MKKNKKQILAERIIKHGNDLKQIFELDVSEDPTALCKRLRRLELLGERLAVDYCNGDLDSDAYETTSGKLLDKVDKILNFTKLGIPVFHNGDPRGYALKIRDEYVREYCLEIHRDWGGYGIIAPDLREER